MKLPPREKKSSVIDSDNGQHPPSDIDVSELVDRAIVEPAKVKPIDISVLNDCVVVPELPSEALPDFERGKHAGRWLDAYVDYGSKVAPMTPEIFHESGGLWLGASAIARRQYVPMSFGNIYPNLFILWLAPSTLYRKSTGLDIVEGLAREVFPHMLAPQDATPEALISDLAGVPPTNHESMREKRKTLWEAGRNFAGQKGLIRDEMSGLVSSFGRDYNASLVENLLKLYDCSDVMERSTKGAGRVTVENAYLSLLGASTPAAMTAHLKSSELWGNGWWARHAILTPDSKPIWKDTLPGEVHRPPEIESGLRRVYASLPQPEYPTPPKAQAVPFDDSLDNHQAFETWQKYNKACSYDMLVESNLDDGIMAGYGRLPIHALKVSIVLAAFDLQGVGDVVIRLEHMIRAIEIVEGWRASMHRALATANTTKHGRIQQRVLSQLSLKEPDGITMRDLKRSMRDTPGDDIEIALGVLIKDGLVERIETKPGPKGGRPTERIRFARHRS